MGGHDMTLLNIKRHLQKNRAAYYRTVPIAILSFAVFTFALQNSHPFTSAEVAFSDTAPSSGLAIVPASCPSSPDTGSCGCGPKPTNCSVLERIGFGNSASCTCPAGYTFDGNWCVVTGSSCNITPTTCPVGYIYDGAQCVFTSCPYGYTQTTDGSGNPACVETTVATCTPTLLCNGTDGNLYQRNADCSFSPTPTTACQYGCTGDTCNAAPAPQVVTFSLAPSLVQSGKTTVVSWNVSNVTDCTVTGSNTPSDSWTQPSGTTSWTGSGVTSSIVGQTIYTLHCTPLKGWVIGIDNTPGKWVDQTVTVNIVPIYHEQ